MLVVLGFGPRRRDRRVPDGLPQRPGPPAIAAPRPIVRGRAARRACRRQRLRRLAFSRRGYLRRGAGSGVIVHPSGYIATNSHVIRGGQRFFVQLFQRQRPVPGPGGPQRSRARPRPAQDQRPHRAPAPRPRSRRRVASCWVRTAIAVGNPRGLGDTITVGVVSAPRPGREDVHRDRASEPHPDGTRRSTPANSGGALLNLDGELIGVIVLAAAERQRDRLCDPGGPGRCAPAARAAHLGAGQRHARCRGPVRTPPDAVAQSPLRRPSYRSGLQLEQRVLPDPSISGGTPGPRARGQEAEYVSAATPPTSAWTCTTNGSRPAQSGTSRAVARPIAPACLRGDDLLDDRRNAGRRPHGSVDGLLALAAGTGLLRRHPSRNASQVSWFSPFRADPPRALHDDPPRALHDDPPRALHGRVGRFRDCGNRCVLIRNASVATKRVRSIEQRARRLRSIHRYARACA